MNSQTMLGAPVSFCTLTGADETTDLHALTSLSEQYRFAEWGFLYSPKRQGTPGRYPSISTLRKAFETLPSNVAVALHYCGAGVPDLFSAGSEADDLLRLVVARGGRVQLNFSAARGNVSTAAIRKLISSLPDTTFITQHNQGNSGVHEELRGLGNHAVLFDTSGGRGISPDSWPAPLDGVSCGYAGGLGPDNLAMHLMSIDLAAYSAGYWIDMEGRIRDGDDRFSLDAAERCLKIVDNFRRYHP